MVNCHAREFDIPYVTNYCLTVCLEMLIWSGKKVVELSEPILAFDGNVGGRSWLLDAEQE